MLRPAAMLHRSQGDSDGELLALARTISNENPEVRNRQLATNAYFIGKCLLDRRDPRAIAYLRRSLSTDPWNLRHWAALFLAALCCRSSPKFRNREIRRVNVAGKAFSIECPASVGR